VNHLTPSGRLRQARLLALIVLVGLVFGACSASPAATFNPSGPCVVDGRLPGAYPDLELRIPKSLDGRGADQLDSGRNCSAANLGTLAGHGVSQVTFAGGVWTDSSTQGITLAVFTAPGLQAAWLGEWFEASARAAKDTQDFVPTRLQIAGRDAYRLDLLNGDVHQSVIVWLSPSADVVQVVIASGVTEERITAGIAAFP
jgi:hypothetical protein